MEVTKKTHTFYRGIATFNVCFVLTQVYNRYITVWCEDANIKEIYGLLLRKHILYIYIYLHTFRQSKLYIF